jgi:hypothetical protein
MNKSGDPPGWHGWPEQTDQKEDQMSWKRVERNEKSGLGVVKEEQKEGLGVSRAQALSRASIPIGAHIPKWTGGLFLVHLFSTLCITRIRHTRGSPI